MNTLPLEPWARRSPSHNGSPPRRDEAFPDLAGRGEAAAPATFPEFASDPELTGERGLDSRGATALPSGRRVPHRQQRHPRQPHPVEGRNIHRCVAQLGSAIALGAMGRRFESCHADHN